MRVGRSTRTILAAAGITLLAAAPASARTYGLVIGVDDYQHLPSLNGAVNDARDIASALRASGVNDVTMLLDRDATREAIFQAWNNIVAKARLGDTVVFSYAGHGGQERERVQGSEEDGLDEVFLLSGFKADASGNGQRIIDDEINKLFTDARHLKIVFIADSCHSGTMTRSFDERTGGAKTRLGNYGDIVDDQLPEPDTTAATLDPELMDNVVFFGAVQDHEVALEFPIDGQSRGALSYSFARAIRGHADQDGDSVIGTRELEIYLVEKVRTMSEGRQFPQMVPRGQPTEIEFPVPNANPAATQNTQTTQNTEPTGEPVQQAPADTQNAPADPSTTQNTAATQNEGGSIRIAVLGTNDGDALAERLRDTIAAPKEVADLIWDTASGEIISSSGDIVARLGPGTNPHPVQPVVNKWLLLRELGTHAESQPLSLRIDAGNQTHRDGAQLSILLNGHQHEHLTLFNLAVDGTVQFLVPWPSHADKNYHGKVWPDRPFEFALRVSEPYGADHLVALTSATKITSLHIDLLGLDGTKSAGHLRAIIAKHLKGQKFQLGSVGLFTAP